MNRLTVQAILNAFQVASSDPMRYHLNSVCLNSVTGDHVRIRATNGHILSEVTLEDQDLAHALGESEYCVDRECVVILKAMLKGNIQEFEVIQESKSKFKFGYAHFFAIATKPVNDFPSTDSLYPSYSVEPFQVQFSAEYLLSMAKALDAGRKDYAVTLVIKDKTSPIVVISGEGRKGLLMPRRFDAKQFVSTATDEVKS